METDLESSGITAILSLYYKILLVRPHPLKKQRVTWYSSSNFWDLVQNSKPIRIVPCDMNMIKNGCNLLLQQVLFPETLRQAQNAGSRTKV